MRTRRSVAPSRVSARRLIELYSSPRGAALLRRLSCVAAEAVRRIDFALSWHSRCTSVRHKPEVGHRRSFESPERRGLVYARARTACARRDSKTPATWTQRAALKDVGPEERCARCDDARELDGARSTRCLNCT